MFVLQFNCRHVLNMVLFSFFNMNVILASRGNTVKKSSLKKQINRCEGYMS